MRLATSATASYFETAVIVWKRLHGVAPTYLQWTASEVVNGYDLHRLIASRHQSDSGASLFLGLQYGTVCHQPCLSLNIFQQKLLIFILIHIHKFKTSCKLICSDNKNCQPAPLWHFCDF